MIKEPLLSAIQLFGKYALSQKFWCYIMRYEKVRVVGVIGIANFLNLLVCYLILQFPKHEKRF